MEKDKKTKIAILQSNYIPWKGYFDIINSVDKFVIYDEVQFTKNDWRNRNKIKSKDGMIWLTIPVKQFALEQRIDETTVALTNWNRKHWNSIVTYYSKAENFKNVKAFVEDLFMNVSSVNLSEINIYFIKGINNFLGIETQIINSAELKLEGDRNERLVDACVKLNGDIYLSGPSAKNYLDVELFNNRQIEVEWIDYSGYSEYPQLFPPFTHEVSILDVILNTGYDAKKFLKSNKQEKL